LVYGRRDHPSGRLTAVGAQDYSALMGEYVRPDAVASGAEKDARLCATAAMAPVETAPARFAPSVAPVLRLQRAAGNRATVSALGLGRPGHVGRQVARCGAHCSCTDCSSRARQDGEDDHFSASLQRAVLARTSSVGSAAPARADRPGGDPNTIAGLLLQRQADAGPGDGRGGADLDAGVTDGGESLPGGVTTPPGPASPPDPRDNCRVEVRNTHIGGSLGWAPIWHLYLVHTDEQGRQTGWRGGPGGPGAAGAYGSIISTTGRYAPGFVDWDTDSDSVTVGMGSGVCGKTSCFASEMSRIDAKHTPYSPTGPNSNTWVRTVLHNCGLREDKPVWVAPGFGDPYL
jgi:hypothetical protein